MAINNQGSLSQPSLKAWLQKYVTADSDSLDTESSELITGLKSDQLDVDAIESRIQSLLKDVHIENGFCASCNRIFTHWPALNNGAWEVGIARYFHTEEVEAASRAGCKFCDFIMGRFQHHDGLLDTFRKIEARLAAEKNAGNCSLAVQNLGGAIGAEAQNQGLWVNLPGKEMSHINNACDSGLVDFVSEVLAEDATLWNGEVASLDLVKLWLSECCDCHREKCGGRDTLDGPTRLISIQDEVIKLVERASLDHVPQYATLTYCWGNVYFYKLTRDTYAELLAGISLDQLPQTFQDAITAARHLGLNYIWIDALCIIQEEPDKSDWLMESGRMMSVYSGSLVTLAASSASGVHQGFLSNALHPKYQGGFYVEVETDTCRRKQNFHSPGVFFESIMYTRLYGRAWAMQERLLSRRTVLFNEYGIFWQCYSTSRSEFIPGGFGGHPGPTLMYPDKEALPWLDVICQYSEAKLTYESDRLPALSGIAARQHRVTGDKYLAGLWEKDLVPSLLWFSINPTKRPKSRIPSWTWASINGPCSIKDFSRKGSEQQVRLLDAWTTVLGPDPFGPVTGGEIALACHSLVLATLDCTGFQNPNIDSHENVDDLAVTVVNIHNSSLEPFPIKLDCVEQVTVEKEPIYLLPVIDGKVFLGCESEDEELDFEAPTIECSGLVLRPVAEKTGYFTRIGIFGFSNKPLEPGMEQRDLYVEFRDIMSQHGKGTASSVCEQTNTSGDHPGQEYVIKII